MTRSEQEVFNRIRRIDIISSKNLKEVSGEGRNTKINKVLSSLARKGYLYRLARGEYLVQETPQRNQLIQDPIKIATTLFSGYIGLQTALRLYGLSDYEPFVITVITQKKSGERNIGEYTIKAISFGKRAFGTTYLGGYYVSGLEKTFFDCFYKPQFVGYDEITKGMYQTKLKWDMFLGYFKKLSSPALCQRTGYVLEVLKRRTGYRVPNEIITYFKRRVKNKTRLMPTIKSSGRYIKDWKVMDNIGEKNIIGWFTHG